MVSHEWTAVTQPDVHLSTEVTLHESTYLHGLVLFYPDVFLTQHSVKYVLNKLSPDAALVVARSNFEAVECV